MADSLRDQLLKSGIVKQVATERARDTTRKPFNSGKSTSTSTSTSTSPHGKSKPRPPAGGSRPARDDQSEMDLAKAYALRARTEAGERKKEEQAVAEQARLRRERKAKLQQLLSGKELNKPEAEQARNFEYSGKIRRIHVDAEQLVALNAGDLGVVQQRGRYLLVTRELAEQVMSIDPQQVALLVDPSASAESDDGVPDDLIW